MADLCVVPVGWDDRVAVGLRREMYGDLAGLYPDETAAAEAAGGFEALDGTAAVGVIATLVAQVGGVAIGCAALRLLGPGGAPDRGP